MFSIITCILLCVSIWAVPRFLLNKVLEEDYRWVKWPYRVIAGFLAFLCFASTSVIMVPADKVGAVKIVYGYKSLPEGHIIATEGETGWQAQIIPPGAFHIWPFYNVFNTVEYMPIVHVPNGFYARVVARDGASLPTGQIMADEWPDSEFSKFLNAEYFMTHGGQKGEQLSVLKPGTYPMNLKLFQVRIGYIKNGKDISSVKDDVYDENGYTQDQSPFDTSITRVPAGFVGVVRSSVEKKGTDCEAKKVAVSDNATDGFSADLVPMNCKGIWSASLPPNDYYINKDAYDITLFDTRVQTLDFKGDFKRRWLRLSVDAKGDFTQQGGEDVVPADPNAADIAVNTKVEGWEIPQELRAVIQIDPAKAPVIVAAVGGLSEVEKRIMVPSIRSNVRNVYGGKVHVTEPDPADPTKTRVVERPTLVLDTVTQRQALENDILRLVSTDGKRAGIDVKEIRLGESVIPPELLLARQRQQLAGQLKTAFEQEQAAQVQRQQLEAAKATAEKQKDLVAAQIDVQTATLRQQESEAKGNAEKLYLTQVASGQAAQTAVLGKENVIMLKQMEMAIALLDKHPDIISGIKLPNTMFIGGNSMENSAGLLGMLGRIDPAATRPGPVANK